jgi:hypothetical protein
MMVVVVYCKAGTSPFSYRCLKMRRPANGAFMLLFFKKFLIILRGDAELFEVGHAALFTL